MHIPHRLDASLSLNGLNSHKTSQANITSAHTPVTINCRQARQQPASPTTSVAPSIKRGAKDPMPKVGIDFWSGALSVVPPTAKASGPVRRQSFSGANHQWKKKMARKRVELPISAPTATPNAHNDFDQASAEKQRSPHYISSLLIIS